MLLLLLSVGAAQSWRGDPSGGDIGLYADYGGRALGGEIPYRDFFIEYPPGAVGTFVLPALGHPELTAYSARFVFEMIAWTLLALASMSLVLRALESSLGHHLAALGRVVALAPLLLGSITFKRYDAAPAALTAVVLALAVAGRLRWSGFATGVAIAVKLYPLVLLPVLVAAGWRRGGWREGVTVAASAVAGTAAIALPFLLLAPLGVYESLGFQISRSLQMETPAAAFLLAVQSLTDVGVRLADEAQTQKVAGSVGPGRTDLTTLAFLFALAFVWRRATTLAVHPAGLVLSAAACICIAVVLGRVLSPQYIVWLLPIVPLAPGGWGIASAGLLAATCLLTRLWNVHYQQVVDTLERSGIGLLVARNAVLVALLGLLLVAVARAREPT